MVYIKVQQAACPAQQLHRITSSQCLSPYRSSFVRPLSTGCPAGLAKTGLRRYIEIADKTFAHLHGLSLEWHLKKKMGPGTLGLRSIPHGPRTSSLLCHTPSSKAELGPSARGATPRVMGAGWRNVIRSMDRGIQAHLEARDVFCILDADLGRRLLHRS